MQGLTVGGIESQCHTCVSAEVPPLLSPATYTGADHAAVLTVAATVVGHEPAQIAAVPDKNLMRSIFTDYAQAAESQAHYTLAE